MPCTLSPFPTLRFHLQTVGSRRPSWPCRAFLCSRSISQIPGSRVQRLDPVCDPGVPMGLFPMRFQQQPILNPSLFVWMLSCPTGKENQITALSARSRHWSNKRHTPSTSTAFGILIPSTPESGDTGRAIVRPHWEDSRSVVEEEE